MKQLALSYHRTLQRKFHR
uniref:Uncharacterized protein n=1 Tax=Rhizophora mucronata TaxID=61149 RepID=A0A2P2NE90_RHIMU